MQELSLLACSLPKVSRLNDQGEVIKHWSEGEEDDRRLSLELEEVKHIRSVLSKANLEVNLVIIC